MKIKLVKFAEDIFNHMLTPKFTQVISETFDIETFDIEKIYDKK